jgi:hypothetical protein
MTILLSQAKAFVRKVAGGGTPELTDEAAYVTMAGEQLAGMHPWTFLRRPIASVNFVAAQEWAALPADFGELVAIERSNLDGWMWVGMDEILEMRYAGQAIAAGYVGCITYALPGTATPPDAPRIELFPTPSANSTGALRLAYRAAIGLPSSDSHALQIPGWADLLFYEVLRAVVLGTEEHDNGGVSERMAAVQGGMVFATAIRRDTEVAPNAGFLRNGVGQAGRQFDDIGEAFLP